MCMGKEAVDNNNCELWGQTVRVHTFSDITASPLRFCFCTSKVGIRALAP